MNKTNKTIFFIILILVLFIIIPKNTAINVEYYNKFSKNESNYVWTMPIFADMDAYIDSLAGMEGGENHGNEGCLKVGYQLQVDYIYRAYSLLRFNLDDIPNDAVISEAILWMYPIEWDLKQLEVVNIIEPWNEDTVTWDNQPDTPSGPYIPIINDPQLYFWDVTSLVNSWWTGAISNYGIMVRPYTSDRYYVINFHDMLDLDPQYWPRIEITFVGSAPPPWDPPVPPDDNYDPLIDISISPSDPSPGDIVTVIAEASDDVGLRWMRLTVTGPVIAQEWDSDLWLGETPHSLSFIQEFDLGIHYVEAEVRDVSGKSSSAVDSFEVLGSGTPPVITISCNPVELWPEDNKTINVTVTANDPEGIRSLKIGVENGFISPDSFPDFGEILFYYPPYPNEVNYTFSTKNIDIPHRFNPLSHYYTEIFCKAHAQDAEYLWSSIESFEINITRPYQWDYGLPYPNPSRNTLPWQRMYDIFGEGECWGPGSLHWWKRIVALETYGGPSENGVKYVCKGGECVGMSCYSLVYAAHEKEIPNYFNHSGTDDFMRPWSSDRFWNAQNCTQRSIERFQGAQYSDENLEVCYDQLTKQRYKTVSEGIFTNFVENQIPKIIEDIELGRQGYISIKKEQKYITSGHAVVPWHIQQLESGIWRIYVYDCNRNCTSLINESNPMTRIQWIDEYGNPVYSRWYNYNEYDEYELYPYIDVSPYSLWFKWPGGSIWDGMIAYMPYNVAIKDDYDLVKGWDYWRLVG